MLIMTISFLENFYSSSPILSTVGVKAHDKNSQQSFPVSWMPLSTAAYLKHIQYSAFAPFNRQPEGPLTSKRDTPPLINAFTGSSGYADRRERGKGGGIRNRKKVTAAELAQAKITNPSR